MELKLLCSSRRTRRGRPVFVSFLSFVRIYLPPPPPPPRARRRCPFRPQATTQCRPSVHCHSQLARSPVRPSVTWTTN